MAVVRVLKVPIMTGESQNSVQMSAPMHRLNPHLLILAARFLFVACDDGGNQARPTPPSPMPPQSKYRT